MKTKRTSQYANELVAAYLYRMSISRVRACTYIYVHPRTCACGLKCNDVHVYLFFIFLCHFLFLALLTVQLHSERTCAYVGLCAYFSCTRMYVYSIINTQWCLPLKDRADYTHTNNARYSNGSSLPVEGLEIHDV